MEDRKLDSLIAETLEQQVSQVSMSPDLQRQIKLNIRTNQLKEESMRCAQLCPWWLWPAAKQPAW